MARHENLVPRIARAHPGQPVVFVEDGAVGATVLALRGAGATVDEGVFARVEDTLARLR